MWNVECGIENNTIMITVRTQYAFVCDSLEGLCGGDGVEGGGEGVGL